MFCEKLRRGEYFMHPKIDDLDQITSTRMALLVNFNPNPNPNPNRNSIISVKIIYEKINDQRRSEKQ